MSRILIGLASLNSILLLLSFGVGFGSEGRVGLTPGAPLSAGQQLFTFHLITGLLASLFTLLLHSLIFTYFIGTGRWVREVVAAYQLPESLSERAHSLKIHALPFILGSILLVFSTATLGAATDRGMIRSSSHLALAALALAFNFWSYIREYRAVQANAQLITEIMSEVTRMRRERGLLED